MFNVRSGVGKATPRAFTDVQLKQLANASLRIYSFGTEHDCLHETQRNNRGFIKLINSVVRIQNNSEV